jgi:hypothetical protein
MDTGAALELVMNAAIIEREREREDDRRRMTNRRKGREERMVGDDGDGELLIHDWKRCSR